MVVVLPDYLTAKYVFPTPQLVVLSIVSHAVGIEQGLGLFGSPVTA